MDTDIQTIARLISFNKDFLVESCSSLLPMRRFPTCTWGSQINKAFLCVLFNNLYSHIALALLDSLWRKFNVPKYYLVYKIIYTRFLWRFFCLPWFNQVIQMTESRSVTYICCAQISVSKYHLPLIATSAPWRNDSSWVWHKESMRGA